MKAFLIAVIVLLLLVVVAVFRAPASLLPTLLAEAEARQILAPNAPKLALADLAGTLWQGQANKSSVTIDGTTVDLGVLSWQLDPMSLIDSQPVIDLQTRAPEQNLSATVIASPTGEITLNNVEGRLSIAVLEPWFPMLVRGDIAFVFDHIIANPQKLIAMDGVLNLEYVDWLGGDEAMPLGSYMAQITYQGQQVEVDINDFSASLGMVGLLTINPANGAYQFNATLQPRPELAPQVAESIAWLGKRNGAGDIVIKQRGRF